MFSTIISHERQIDALKRALERERLPNAYLFTGLRGVGKRRTADALAAAIACAQANAPAWEACATCPSCRKRENGSHPDLFVITPEVSERVGFKSIKIEGVRTLQGRLQYHALEAKAKLAIIDEADCMIPAAANAMLKILEEPPPATHFILISSMPHRLLPTIRSRCRELRFEPIPDAAIAQALMDQRGLGDLDATRIARLAGGSLGQALALDPELVDDVLGRFFALIRRGSAADILETAQAWAGQDAERTALTFDLIASVLGDLLRTHATGTRGALIHPEAHDAASAWTERQAQGAFEAVERARRASSTTANKQLMFEELLFTLAGR